jgi:hypothetical protein
MCIPIEHTSRGIYEQIHYDGVGRRIFPPFPLVSPPFPLVGEGGAISCSTKLTRQVTIKRLYSFSASAGKEL